MHPSSRYVAISQDRINDNGDISNIEGTVLASTEVDKGGIDGNASSINRDDNDRVSNNGDANNTEDGTVLASTEIDSSENTKNSTINRSYRIYRLTWDDANGQKQQTYPQHEVMLQIYINTLSNTAIFKIHTKVTLKRSRRKNKEERVYLCIHPE